MLCLKITQCGVIVDGGSSHVVSVHGNILGSPELCSGPGTRTPCFQEQLKMFLLRPARNLPPLYPMFSPSKKPKPIEVLQGIVTNLVAQIQRKAQSLLLYATENNFTASVALG